MPGDCQVPPPLVKCQVKKQLKPWADMGKEKGGEPGWEVSSPRTPATPGASCLPASVSLSVKPEQKAYFLKSWSGQHLGDAIPFHSHAVLPSRGASDPCSHRRGAEDQGPDSSAGVTVLRQYPSAPGPPTSGNGGAWGASLTLLSGWAQQTRVPCPLLHTHARLTKSLGEGGSPLHPPPAAVSQAPFLGPAGDPKQPPRWTAGQLGKGGSGPRSCLPLGVPACSPRLPYLPARLCRHQ